MFSWAHCCLRSIQCSVTQGSKKGGSWGRTLADSSAIHRRGYPELGLGESSLVGGLPEGHWLVTCTAKPQILVDKVSRGGT